MRALITILLAGCAQTYLPVIEGDRIELIGAPEDSAEIVEEAPSLSVSTPEASPEEAAEEEPPTPGVFFPGKIDVAPPVEEPELEPLPGLSMEQTGVSYYSINGLAISRDGTTGMLGMSGGNSCEYDPDIAAISGADFSMQVCPDIPEEYDNFGRVMFLCGEVVGFWSETWGSENYVVPGLLDAQISDDGFVTLENDGSCMVSRRGHDGSVSSVVLPDELCETSPHIEINEVDDIVYFANGDLYAVTDTDYRMLAFGVGDLVAYDTAHNALLVAWEAEPTLAALDHSGALRWRVEASGGIYDLAPVGDQGAVFALVYDDISLPGSFVAYDADRGEVWGEGLAWDGLVDFSIDAAGSKMLVQAGGSVYTYEIVIEE